ncbi:prolyl oligopeptidase family serine peptidase [Chloroflexota bacterium]
MISSIPFSRYLNIHSAYAPAWLDGGQRVAFLTDITGTPQVWAVDANGGWLDQLTFFTEKVWTLSAAPDGKHLICTRDIGGNERYQMFLLDHDGQKVARISRNMDAIYHFGAWSPDGKQIAFSSNERNGLHFDVYVQDLGGGKPEMVYQSTGMLEVSAWSPGGSQLILLENISSAQMPLHLLDLPSGKIKPLTPLGEPINNTAVIWAKDGPVCILTNRNRDFLGIADLDVTTGEITYLFEDLERNVEGLAISPDGRMVAYTVNQDGYKHLFILNKDTSETKSVSNLPTGVIDELTFSPDGKSLAVSVQSPSDNLNIWVIDLETLTSRKITNSATAGITQTGLLTPELVHYETFDGRSIPAFWYRPQDVEPPYPVILYVHGGPASQTIADFDPRFQFFLSRGYAILAPNVRGSSGYGKSYMVLDDVELRMDSVADLKYAVEWLRDSGEVDPQRIAIYGRSYGGFMVLSAITTYPNLWAAAIDVVGIADWVTFLENTSIWRRTHREKEYGSLEHDREFLPTISPIHKVDQIQCPLLVVHGANDPRVPVTEADQIVESLRKRDHPVEYLRYEDEGHKIAKLTNRIDSFTKMADFLEKYL